MFPIKDDNPTVLTPFVTYGLVALNALAWFGLQGAGSDPALAGSVCQLGLIPGELFSLATPGERVELGEAAVCRLTGAPNWTSVVAHMFLHGGWMHIIGNMWFLWIFGNNVEDSMGHGRFVAFYLLCGLAAAAAQVFSDPGETIPMVGASGAIGGVMGAYILLYPRVKVHLLLFLGFFITTVSVPALWMLGYWLLVQLVGGAVSIGAEGGGTAFWAHVGGFVAGMLLIFPFKDPKLVARHPFHGWNPRARGG